MWRNPRFLLLLLLAPSAACSDTSGLADATLANVIDTTSLGSLVGTPISVASAYSVPEHRAVRSDQTSSFDFAYNSDTLPDGTRRHYFLPRAVLGLGTDESAQPGLKPTSLPFGGIRRAESNGYVTEDTVFFAPGDRFFLRSRIVCSSLGVPQYGKLEVLAIDEAALTVTFQALTNNNCGYRSLEPGVPDE